MSWGLWLLPFALGLPASLLVLAVSLPGPQPNKVAAVFLPFGGGTSGLTRLLAAEPDLALVDMAWGGRLVFVIPPDPNFSAKAAKAGALFVVEAGAVACGYDRPAGV